MSEHVLRLLALATAAIAIASSSCAPAPPVEPAGARPLASVRAPDPPTADPVASASASAAPPPVPVAEPLSEPLLPTGFVAVREAEAEPVQVKCGDFTVENAPSPDPKGNYEPFVRAYDKSGKKIYEAHGRRYEVDAGITFRQSLVIDICGDLTGDGTPELIMTERTMGAHCCYTHYVVSLTTPVKRLLMWEKGDSGDGMLPIRFSKSGAWQVMSYDRIYPPFNSEAGDPALSYAGVPGFPIVFDLVGGEYKRRTFAFKEALRDLREKDHAACATRPDCEPYEIYEWGLALIIGDWEKEKTKIVADPKDREPFERRAKEMTNVLRSRLGP